MRGFGLFWISIVCASVVCAPGLAWSDGGDESATRTVRGQVVAKMLAGDWTVRLVEKSIRKNGSEAPRREVWLTVPGRGGTMSELPVDVCPDFHFESLAEQPYLSLLSLRGQQDLVLLRLPCADRGNRVTLSAYDINDDGIIRKRWEAVSESLLKERCPERLGVRVEREVTFRARRLRLVREKLGAAPPVDAPICQSPVVTADTVVFEVTRGCYARVPGKGSLALPQPWEATCMPGRGLEKVIGEVTAKGGGQAWNVRLLWQYDQEHPAEGEQHEVRLIVARGGRKVSELLVHDNGRFDIDSVAERPYLSVMRLQGRDFLLLRSPHDPGSHVITFSLFEITAAGRLVKRFEASQQSRMKDFDCRDRSGLHLESDNEDGSRLRLVRQMFGPPSTPASLPCQDPVVHDVTVHFVWTNGCYARVPGEELDHPQDWDRICAPGKGLVVKQRSLKR